MEENTQKNITGLFEKNLTKIIIIFKMEKPDIELQKLEIEKIKVSIERGKIIEGQIRTLVIVLIAVVGGVIGIILSFDRYLNKDLAISIISIGIFLSGLLIYVTLDLWFELERLKERWKKWRH